MSRLERVINLINALIDTKQPLTRSEIQERVPGYTGNTAAIRRTFERDKAMLRDIGIPLDSVAVDGDPSEEQTGYRISKDRYQLPDPGLTREELSALAIALAGVRLPGHAATAALLKLGADPAAESANDISLNVDDRLAVLFSARRQRHPVEFTYSNSTRRINPHRISFRNGHWYVHGFDHNRNEARTYRVDRISTEITTDTTVKFDSIDPQQIWLPPWQMGEGAPELVSILIDADQASLVLSQAGDVAAVHNPDGSVIIDLSVTNLDALRSFVLGFLHHAEILEPEHVRQDFIQYLESLRTHSETKQ